MNALFEDIRFIGLCMDACPQRDALFHYVATCNLYHGYHSHGCASERRCPF